MGNTGTYTYDSLDRLTNVNFGGVSAAYTYDANNRLLTETRGSHTSTYTYNKAGLVTYLQNSSGDMYNYSYTYRLDGNQLTKYDGEYTDMYTYNDLGQLTSEYMHYDTTYFEYDTRGNRIEAYENNKWYTTEYEYDKNNRLIGSYKYSENNYGDETSVEYEYDANGNLLFKGIGITDDATNEPKDAYLNGSVDYGTSYIYNTRGQMTGVLTDSKTISYAYDPIGRRSSKTVNGQTTNHYWDGSDIVRETGTNNAVYYKGINLIAQQIDGAVGYYLYNAHGDITGITGGKARSVGTFEYSAFVGGRPGNGAETPFRYNGQYHDEETGLIYLRNRYYDSSTGRFTQEDTYWNVNNMIYGDNPNNYIPSYSAIAQSNNLYVYCINNPVNLSDPTGMNWMSDLGASLRRATDMVANYYWTLLQNNASEFMKKFVDTGFYYAESQNIWYSHINAWQRNFGYCNFYDEVAVSVMNIEYTTFFFNYDNKAWRIEFWKGDYGPTVGAEVGLYYKEGNSNSQWYQCASNEDCLTMSMNLSTTSGEQLFSRTPVQTWWLTGFQVRGDIDPSKYTLFHQKFLTVFWKM